MGKWFLFCFVLLAMCRSSRCHGDYKQYMDYVKNFNPDREYYYVMPEANQEKLFKNIDKVQLGDTPEKVITLLGKPDVYRSRKHWFFGNIISYTIIYRIKKIRATSPDPFHDINVFCFFNRNKELCDIHVANFNGIHKVDKDNKTPLSLSKNLGYFLEEKMKGTPQEDTILKLIESMDNDTTTSP